MRPDLVTIRFHTARATLTSVHYAGIHYDVDRTFAKTVVDEERVAEYVHSPASSSDHSPIPKGKKR